MIRTLSLLITSLYFLSLIGCSSSTSSDPQTVDGDYFPMTTGSTWTYKNADSSETTMTITGSQTINGKTYQYVSTTDSSDSGLRRDGKTVYMLFPDSTGTGLTEVPVLKEEIGATWTYKLSIFFTMTFSNKTVTLHPTHTVRGRVYNSVLQVHSDITIEGLPVGSSSDTYYAKGVGMIEVVNSDDSENQQLMSYDIK